MLKQQKMLCRASCFCDKNAQNAKMNMALSKQRWNAEDEVCCSAFTNCIKIAGVMGSRESNDGLHF